MNDNKIFALSGWIMVFFIGGILIKLAKPVLFPFFLALFIYFILSPVLDFFCRLKIPRTLSITFIVIISFFLLYLLGILFYSSGKAFAAEFPKYGQKINSLIETLKHQFDALGIEWSRVTSMENLDINRIASFFLSSLGTFLSFISNLFLIFIFLIFMLAGRGRLKGKIESSFSASRAGKIIGVVDNIDSQIQRYLAIKTVISLISGISATLILVIFGVDFAVVFGFLTFLLNYIPNIGSLVAKVFPVVIAAVQFNTLWPAFWVLVVLVLTDAFVAYFVEPKLMGRGLGLSPLAVLFALILWGWLWGIPGMILAVPIIAVMNIVCSNLPSLQFIAALLSK